MPAATGGTTPTNAELMRAIEAMRTDFRDLTSRLEVSYVRKDVYMADRAADTIQMQGLEDSVHLVNRRIDKTEDSQATNRRALVASFLFPLAVAIIVLLLHGAVQ